VTRRFWFGSFGALLLLAAIGTTALLAGMALAGKEAQAPAGSDRSVVLSYRFTVRDLPRDAAKARIWIPLPAENSHQRLRRFDLKGGHRYQLVTDAEYGNRFLRLDLPASELSGKGESQIALDFDVTRKAYRVEAGAKAGDAVPKELLKRFLSPDRLVPIDGQISKEARRVAGDARSPLERARRLYDHIVASMR